MFKKISIFLMTTFALGVSVVFCYDNIITHPQLSRVAVQLYNNSTNINKINTEQANWIEYGAVNEDTDPRYVNHFYNPKTGGGLVNNIFFISSAKEWAQKQISATGDYSYQTVIDNYKQGNKERAWQGVGHILHLVQDMSVPAHVRIDEHGAGDPYEVWAQYFGRVDNLQFSKISVAGLGEVFDNLSIFTFDNFFSKDTINTLNIDSYKKVTKEVDGKNRLYLLKNVNGIDYVVLYSKNPDSINPVYAVDDDQYLNQSYWNLLAPKAIGYSAGVIELFKTEFQKIDDQKEAQAASLSWMQKRENELRSLMTPALSLSDLAYHWGDAFMALRPIVTDKATALMTVVGVGESTSGIKGEVIVDTSKTVAGNPASAGAVLGEKILAGNVVQAATATSAKDKEIVKIASVNTQNKNIDDVKVTRVIDGDTIELSTGEKVRYIGVDAPELNGAGSADDDCLAWAAKVRNEQLIQSGAVRLVADAGADKDGYGRLLRYVYAGDIFINERLAVEGFAETLFCQAGWTNCPVMSDMVRKKIIQDAGASAVSSKRGIYSSVCKAEAVKPLSVINLAPVVENKIQPKTQELAKGVSLLIFGSGSSNHDKDLALNDDKKVDIIDVVASSSGDTATGTEDIVVDPDDEASTSPEDDIDETPGEASTTPDQEASTTPDEEASTTPDEVPDEEASTTPEEEIDFSDVELVLYDLATSNEHFTSSTTVGLRIDGIATSVEYYLTMDYNDPDENAIWLQEPPDRFVISDYQWSAVYLWLRKNGEIWEDSINGSIYFDQQRPDIIYNKKPEATSRSGEAIFNINTDDDSKVNFDEEAVIWNYRLDEGEWLIGTNNGDITFSDLDDGGHVLNIEATDLAFNIATSSYDWIVDSTSPMPDSQADHVVISEIQIGTAFSATEEFIELYNPTDETIDLTNYRLTKKTKGGTETNLVSAFKNTDFWLIYPHGYFLIGHDDILRRNGVFSMYTNFVYTVASESIAANNTITLYSDAGVTVVDQVGYGEATNFEGSPAAEITVGNSIERKHLYNSTTESMNNDDEGGEKYLGNGYDSDNNLNDFVFRNIPDPQNGSSSAEPKESSNAN